MSISEQVLQDCNSNWNTGIWPEVIQAKGAVFIYGGGMNLSKQKSTKNFVFPPRIY